MENKDCWLKNECNHRDCDTFCMRLYKLDYLYNLALISPQQREHITLVVDENGNDVTAFQNLKSIENNIVSFVEKGENIYIHSNICGNGKTSWSLRLCQSYLNKIWFKCDLSCKVLYINVPRFLLALKDNISERNEYVEHIKENVVNVMVKEK